MRRVAVTGLGAVTPLGLDAPSTWRAALAGESGVDFIEAFDPGEFPVRKTAIGRRPKIPSPYNDRKARDRNKKPMAGSVQFSQQRPGLCQNGESSRRLSFQPFCERLRRRNGPR